MTTTTVQGEDPLSGDRQPIDMKPSTDHLMQSMAIGYPGPRTKMDGEHDDGDDGRMNFEQWSSMGATDAVHQNGRGDWIQDI